MAFGKGPEIQVNGGDKACALAVATAPVSASFPAAGWLRNAQGDVPFQKAADGRVIFVIPTLGAGEARLYRVEAGAPPTAAKAERQEGQVRVSLGGREAFVYQGAETPFPRPDIKPIYKRGGYIHPVFSPSGRLVTDDFPTNHTHHHGIWFPWTKTEFEGRHPDFWNMGDGTGKVEFDRLGATWSGPVTAGFSAEHSFMDVSAQPAQAALRETWTVAAYAAPGRECFVFDLASTQRCATASALKLPKYYYGGLGFRGNWDWNGETNCLFLTASGETNRVKGNETRGDWCYVGGEADHAICGVAILGNPENFRAPQPMRLHPKEPFFCFAPSQLGDWAIEPGQPYVSRYRFVVLDGPPRREELQAMWEGYAHPPRVIVTE